MRQWMDQLVDGIFRGVVGLIVIYIIKQVCLANDFLVFAGVNPMSFLLVAVLGVPGFLLVFAIGVIYFL